MSTLVPDARRVLAILNPVAGSGWSKRTVAKALAGVLPEVELVTSGGPGEARWIAQEAARGGAAMVVAAGGDGLIGEVVDGLMAGGGGPRLGILPLGTGNDLARALGMPLRLHPAVRALAGGETCRVDVGQLLPNSPAEDELHRPSGSTAGESRLPARHFMNVVVAGFGGRLRLRPGTKRRWKRMSYLREIVRHLPELRPHSVALRLRGESGEERYDGTCFMVVVANGRRMGGGIEVAPDARLDDGLLDVVVVPELDPLEVARALVDVLLRRRLPARTAWRRQAHSVHLTGDPPLWLNADGEVLHARPVVFRSLPSVLDLVVPTLSRAREGWPIVTRP